MSTVHSLQIIFVEKLLEGNALGPMGLSAGQKVDCENRLLYDPSSFIFPIETTSHNGFRCQNRPFYGCKTHKMTKTLHFDGT